MKAKRTLDEYIRKMESHLRKSFPGLEFETTVEEPTSATIYFLAREDDDWFSVIERAGSLAIDALVEGGYWIHVQPRIRERTQAG